MKNDKGEEIVAIEYQREGPHRCWIPFSVTTLDGECPQQWDFDWSRKFGTLYYHCSGGGGNFERYHVSRYVTPVPVACLLWIARDIPFYAHDGKRERIVKKADLKHRGYRLIAHPRIIALPNQIRPSSSNPFEIAWESEGGTVYCRICKDRFPDEPCNVCQHLYWCDDCLGWVFESKDGHQDSDNSTADWIRCAEWQRRQERASA